ncbi:hypothetical protein HOI83_04715 [Candidatus Uhrbacteria bacterium]|jgi:hypothetical protein|nr:hypothetical protein [Candidatus Uhrbacteria bacterium]
MAEENIYIYSILPDEIREFFLDSGLKDLDQIGEAYGLSTTVVDGLDDIQQELLFGYAALDSVENLIRVKLGLEAPLARKVSLDLLRTRFLPIDSYMMSSAFRTYANLGGDVSVSTVKRIDATGGTVKDIRKANDIAVAEVKVKRAQAASREREKVNEPEVVEKIDEEIEVEAPVKAEPAPKPPPAPTPEPKVAPPAPVARVVEAPVKPKAAVAPPSVPVQKTPPVKPAVKPVPAKKPLVPPSLPKRQEPKVVKVVRRYDDKLDKMHPASKGEKRELAPPPPMIVDAEPPATKKDVGPMVTSHVEVETDVKPTPAQPKAKKSLRRKSEVVVKPKKRAPVAVKKELFPNVANEAAAASTMQDLKKTGQKAPESLENKKIDEVQRKLSLSFPSSELNKRFRVVLGARYSGVRSAADFKKALEQPIEKGGLALSEHAVNRVVEEVETSISGEHGDAVAKHKAGKEEMVKKKQEKYGAPSSKDPKSSSSPALGASASKSVSQKKSTAKTVLSTPSMAPRVTPSGKKPVTDVRYKKRLVGPIEEFRRMNIDDFRRLPGDISVVQENLMEDINMLGEGDPGLRIRAIEAWRESPLVMMYQKLMGMALQEGIAIESVLKDAKRNPKGMTKEEIDVVRRINSTLRY